MNCEGKDHDREFAGPAGNKSPRLRLDKRREAGHQNRCEDALHSRTHNRDRRPKCWNSFNEYQTQSRQASLRMGFLECLPPRNPILMEPLNGLRAAPRRLRWLDRNKAAGRRLQPVRVIKRQLGVW